MNRFIEEMIQATSDAARLATRLGRLAPMAENGDEEALADIMRICLILELLG